MLVTRTYALLVYLRCRPGMSDVGGLVAGGVDGTALPYEIFELITQQSPSDAIVLGLNLIGLLIVLSRARRHGRTALPGI